MENGNTVTFQSEASIPYQEYGLSKLEYIATQAMKGMLASPYGGEFMSEINDENYDRPHGLANNAVRYAKALLNELEKENQ